MVIRWVSLYKVCVAIDQKDGQMAIATKEEEEDEEED